MTNLGFPVERIHVFNREHQQIEDISVTDIEKLFIAFNRIYEPITLPPQKAFVLLVMANERIPSKEEYPELFADLDELIARREFFWHSTINSSGKQQLFIYTDM